MPGSACMAGRVGARSRINVFVFFLTSPGPECQIACISVASVVCGSVAQLSPAFSSSSHSVLQARWKVSTEAKYCISGTAHEPEQAVHHGSGKDVWS